MPAMFVDSPLSFLSFTMFSQPGFYVWWYWQTGPDEVYQTEILECPGV